MVLSDSNLAEMKAKAEKCDGRRTRCESCARILLLIAHIRLMERAS